MDSRQYTSRKECGKFRVEIHFICVILDDNIKQKSKVGWEIVDVVILVFRNRSTVALEDYERCRVGEEEIPFCECLLR